MASKAPTIRSKAVTHGTSQASKKSRTSYLLDTNKQRFMEEAMEKESMKRIQDWRHNDQSQTSSAEKVSRQYEVSKKKIEQACPRPNSVLAELADSYQLSDYRRRKIDPESSKLQEKNFQAISSSNHSTTATTGCSKYNASPETESDIKCDATGCSESSTNPVSMPMTSNVYGWAFDQLIPKESIQQPLYGKKRTVTDSFYTKNT